GNFVEREDNVFEEIEVDEGKVLVGNEKTVLEENDVIVLDDSEEENKEVQVISVADEAPIAHKEIKVYTSQSTTPDQRRALLFNVGEPFEHNHSSGRKEGIPAKKWRKTKRSEAVQKLVEKEVTKNYSLFAITSAIKDYATRILDLSLSVKELKHAKVTNIKYKVCEVQNDYLSSNKNKKSDIEESILFLKN
ncbi:2698_t:CDS:2, partial [Scutellospora calospora]